MLQNNAAFIVRMAVEFGQRIEAERQGEIVFSRSFLEGLIYRKNKNKFRDQIVPWIALTAGLFWASAFFLTQRSPRMSRDA
jgi:hypothetical protein